MVILQASRYIKSINVVCMTGPRHAVTLGGEKKHALNVANT